MRLYFSTLHVQSPSLADEFQSTTSGSFEKKPMGHEYVRARITRKTKEVLIE